MRLVFETGSAEKSTSTSDLDSIHRIFAPTTPLQTATLVLFPLPWTIGRVMRSGLRQAASRIVQTGVKAAAEADLRRSTADGATARRPSDGVLHRRNESRKPAFRVERGA